MSWKGYGRNRPGLALKYYSIIFLQVARKISVRITRFRDEI